MDLASDFSFQPLPAVKNEVQAPFPEVASPLGPLAGLVNSVLEAAIKGEHITETTTLHVNTNDAPILGGGTANTAFLKGGGGGPNAVSASVNATFWLETIEGNPVVHQLQYTQTVLLNFNTLSWPHITVGTLRPVA